MEGCWRGSRGSGALDERHKLLAILLAALHRRGLVVIVLLLLDATLVARLKHLLHRRVILLQLGDVALHLIELQLEILGLARALPVGDVEFAGHLAQEPLNLLGARHGRRARGDAHAVALRTRGGRGMSAEARL